MKYRIPNDQIPIARKTDPVAEKKPREPFFTPPENANGFFPPAENTVAVNTSSGAAPVIQKKEGPFPEEVQAKMESSFGEDFSNVSVQTDSQKAVELNALAYTQGEEIHFAPGQYNTATHDGQKLIGHELAHVSQQRSGNVASTIQAKGVDINDDAALEKQADSMGEKAASASPGTTYKSKALGMRNNVRTVQMAKKGVVQLASFPTFYGEFKDKTYKPIKENGVDIELEFHAGPTVNATKIGLTQILKSELGGVSAPIGPTQAERMVTGGWAEGTYLDRLAARNNPIYGGQQLTGTDDLTDTGNSSGTYHLGWHFKDAAGAEQSKEAYLHDTPTRAGRGNNSGQMFETTALAVEGAQAGTYYGSVSWGWEVDGSNKFSVLPITVVSKSAPSEKFFKAAEKWNAATSLGTIKTIADPTNVFNNSFNKSFTVAKDEEVTIQSAATHKNIIYQDVTIISTGKTGRIKTGDLKDQGDGAATVDLPIVTEIYVGPFDEIFDIAPLAQVPRTTKVKLLDDSDPITVHVEVMEGSFAGTRGYVNKFGGIPFSNTMK